MNALVSAPLEVLAQFRYDYIPRHIWIFSSVLPFFLKIIALMSGSLDESSWHSMLPAPLEVTDSHILEKKLVTMCSDYCCSAIAQSCGAHLIGLPMIMCTFNFSRGCVVLLLRGGNGLLLAFTDD